jgi:PAS domain S-box-containing protein
MSQGLRVLIVEDSDSDAALVARLLRKAGYDIHEERVESAAEMSAALARQVWDVVISDYALPQFDAPAALSLLQQAGLDIPFIVVSGTIGEETAVTMMKAGAHDYLMKDKLLRLAPAVAREMREAQSRRERRQAEEALHASTKHLSSVFRAAPIGIGLAVDRVLKEANQYLFDMTGYSRAELIGQSARILYPDDAEFERVGRDKYAQIRERSAGSIETRWQRKDGVVRDIFLSSTLLNPTDWSAGMTFAALDITERKQAEAALLKSENDFRRLSEFNRQLNEISIVFNETSDLVSLEESIATSFWQLTGALGATISRYDPFAKTIQVTATAMPEELLAQIESVLGVSLAELKMTIPDEIIPLMTTHFIDRTSDLTALSFGKIAPETAERLIAAIGCGQILGVGLSYGSELIGATIAFLPEGAVEIPDHSLRTFAYMASLAMTRKKAEDSLRASEARFATIFRASPIGISLTRFADGQIADANATFLSMLGYTREEVMGYTTLELGMWPNPAERHRIVRLLHELGRAQNIELRLRRKSGEIRDSLVSAELIELAGERYMVSMIHDITEQKRAEEEKERLQTQLTQAQKMESIGRLAGGVAHDFNNMLNVIMAHAELALNRLNPTDPPFANLQEIYKAAQRSADLTRQLLAFARKQIVAPKVLDLNETIETMLKMLRRLIGEDISLVWMPGAGVWPVKVDPSQIDQILVNLCVNARDAMTGQGRITIETGNVVFDDDDCASNQEAVPGEFILLAVSDDGCGMDEEIRSKLFEPFFTTKELGKGTGLGLATVYGIVKQNNGFIDVYSEPNMGTTFKIYLSRHMERVDPMHKDGAMARPERGNETVLVAEDEPAILEVIIDVLQNQGYTALTATTPGEAMRLARDYAGEIHLLISDVIMPEMNGRDLANNMMLFCPRLKVLYMSGYTADVIAHHGVLDDRVYFIQKPFTIRELIAKVREVLDCDAG